MTYSTVAGDSFDAIAFKVLGSEKYVPELIAANPDYVQTFIFSAGVELTIPEIETPKQSVLPWKS
ncbi:MAG: tail protein X [Selenomonadaceae bacterium]|nr:tail protein X [Selenomonadaceae bacterium]